MLKIAICDDKTAELSRLSALAHIYVEEKKIESEITEFSHPDELISAIDKDNYHIYLLDMVMPMYNGIEVGMTVRRMDRQAQIIYATTEPQYALNSFCVNPLDYLVKPIDEDKLFSALDLAVSKVDITAEKTISIKTADSLRVVRICDIEYCELVRGSLVFVLRDGEIVESRAIRTAFAGEIAQLFSDSSFIMPHGSFAVNMHYVERLDKDGFTMRCGKFVPIVQNNFTEIRKSYLDYTFGRR